MSASHCAQVTACCISCTLPLLATTAASSSTRSFRNICIATAQTAGSWSRDLCDSPILFVSAIDFAPIDRQDRQSPNENIQPLIVDLGVVCRSGLVCC